MISIYHKNEIKSKKIKGKDKTKNVSVYAADFMYRNSGYIYKYSFLNSHSHVRGVPVTTAWCIFRLRMEEPSAAMDGSCEYIE
jgi:hypothetical protein